MDGVECAPSEPGIFIRGCKPEAQKILSRNVIQRFPAVLAIRHGLPCILELLKRAIFD